MILKCTKLLCVQLDLGEKKKMVGKNRKEIVTLKAVNALKVVGVSWGSKL